MIVPDRLAVTIAGSLLLLAAVAWAATYYLMPVMMMQSQGGMMGFGVAEIVASPTIASVSLFELIWIIGMAAMMFPAMIPIVLFYNKIAAKQERNQAFARSVGTLLFLGGYLVVYGALGILAYEAVYGAIQLSMQFSELALVSSVASGAILIATGVYQFTPLKNHCLKNCTSPLGFFTVHYKSGVLGSLRMGLTHGFYCVGCCWAFMLVMLGVGAMSIPIMAAFAGVIAVEKVLVRGTEWTKRIVGAGFILIGFLTLVFPSILVLV